MLATKAPRTPRERTGMVLCPRDAAGRLLPIDALQRFASKCEFDATTGCVLWRGGTTQGRGNTATYGSFWYEGRRWFAHRWSGVHIHGLALDGVQAGHTCPCGPNTLCVEHVAGQTVAENMAEQIARLGPVGKRVEQSSAERQYWLFVQLGIEREPESPARDDSADIPWYEPPEWFRPFMPAPVAIDDDCPF
jgi:hypothetical protein